MKVCVWINGKREKRIVMRSGKDEGKWTHYSADRYREHQNLRWRRVLFDAFRFVKLYVN